MTLRIAYCTECPKPVIIAAGNLPKKVQGRILGDDGKPKMVDAPIPYHRVKGVLHNTKVKVIEVDYELTIGQPAQAELDRLAKDHADKFI